MYSAETFAIARRAERDQHFRNELIRQLAAMDKLITYSGQDFDRTQNLAATLSAHSHD